MRKSATVLLRAISVAVLLGEGSAAAKMRSDLAAVKKWMEEGDAAVVEGGSGAVSYEKALLVAQRSLNGRPGDAMLPSAVAKAQASLGMRRLDAKQADADFDAAFRALGGATLEGQRESFRSVVAASALNGCRAKLDKEGRLRPGMSRISLVDPLRWAAWARYGLRVLGLGRGKNLKGLAAKKSTELWLGEQLETCWAVLNNELKPGPG